MGDGIKKFSIALLLSIAAEGCVLVPFVENDRFAAEQNELAGRGGNFTQSQTVYSAAVPRSGTPDSKVGRYVSQLETGAAVERAHAAFWLGEMGPGARSAIPALSNNLHHENHWVRRACAKALGKIGDPQVIEPLSRALKDRDTFVAHSAANALRKIGTPTALKAVSGYRGI